MDTITLRKPDDFHVHFRRLPMMETVLPFTAGQFGRALVMPNTSPNPILTGGDAIEYRKQINATAHRLGCNSFAPLMTIQITDETTPEMITDACAYGVIAGKVYPKGVTTNSGNGVTDFKRLYPVFAEMERCGMVLSLHGQRPNVFCLDREKEFLATLHVLAKDFPKLRIVLEHISTKESVASVRVLPKTVSATITAHHLLLNLQDVLSWKSDDGREGMNPHHYCQPILQRPEDQAELVWAATSGNPKFFFGSDTAPHMREQKETACGCAGVFSAPVLLPVLVKLFKRNNALEMIESFVSYSGASFYGLPPNEGSITLKKEAWTVPANYGGIVPFMAGQRLNWKVVD